MFTTDGNMMLLIAQAVKSRVPLADAIRLSVEDHLHKPDALETSLLRLAVMLDEGHDPKTAIKQVGLPQPVVGMFDMALQNPDFAGTFDVLAQLEVSRIASTQRLVMAFSYLAFLCGVLLLSLLLFLTFIAPHFVLLFREFGVETPWLTKFVLNISQLLSTGVLFLAGLVFVVVLFVTQRLVFPRFWYLTPMFGIIGRRHCVCRMLREMTCQVRQNVPLPQALEQCGNTMRNAAYRRDCFDAAESARKGMSFAEITLHYDWLFPEWLGPIINAAKSDDDLARSLRRAAETAEMQKDASIHCAQTLALPLFITLMGICFGTLVLAIMMPIMDLVKNLTTL